jgi:hypothetical protein
MDLIIAGMTHQGWDVQLTAYAARDWRANFFPVGIAHSVVGGSAWEPTPSRAVSRVTFHRDAALDLSSAERRAAPRARNRQRFCATSPMRVQMAEGRTPGRLSSYELGVSARLVDRTTDALSSSAPSRPGQIQALHRWVDWPSRVWAPRGSGSQCPSDGHYRGWMWQSRDRLRARHRRRLGAVTHPIAAAMTAARVSCTSTCGAAASASTATTSAFRQGRSYGQQQSQQDEQHCAKNHEHPPSPF